MKLSIFPAVILSALTVLSTIPQQVQAGSIKDALVDTEMAEHRNLVRALQSVGVTVTTNDPRYCDEGTAGSWIPEDKVLTICQDDAVTQDYKMLPWTDNDLDTLRHEAHHVVQDCAYQGLYDGKLKTLFDEETLLSLMQESLIPMERFRAIWKDYSDQGADEDHVILEMEAFLVASDVPASSITKKVVEFCQL